MRLAIPFEATLLRVQSAHGVDVRFAENIILTIGEVEALPPNASRWGERQVAANMPPERIKVRRAIDRELAGGWPVSLIESDILDENGAVLQRRFHALYQFVKHACAAVARGPAADLDRVHDELERLFLAATIEFDDIVALNQIWAGLELREPVVAKEPSPGPQPPADKVDEVK